VFSFFTLCVSSLAPSPVLSVFSPAPFFLFLFFCFCIWILVSLSLSLSLSLSFLLVFAPYLPRIMIRSETLCFGWIGTPTVLPVLDCWWRFPRPAGTLWRWRKVGWKGVRWLTIRYTSKSGLRAVRPDQRLWFLQAGFPLFQTKKKMHSVFERRGFGMGMAIFQFGH